MIRLPRERRHRAILEITPLIDVVFLLLIFFLLTSTSIQRSMDVDLPQARSAELAPPAAVVVSLLADNSVRVDRKTVALEDLAKVLRERLGPEARAPLTIEADRRASFERFARILDQARLAGATQIALATDLMMERR
jgi:biopolymer transport protein ExbD